MSRKHVAFAPSLAVALGLALPITAPFAAAKRRSSRLGRRAVNLNTGARTHDRHR
jgi:hypothetical protein